MRITAIRIRVLRSRPVGYGHDAAEIEAQLEDGDDPEKVAVDLRHRCEAEVRRGEVRASMIDRITDLAGSLKSLEDQAEASRKEVKQARDLLGQFENFVEAAKKAGVHVPAPLAAKMLPF